MNYADNATGKLHRLGPKIIAVKQVKGRSYLMGANLNSIVEPVTGGDGGAGDSLMLALVDERSF
jgi:hypothetical protein